MEAPERIASRLATNHSLSVPVDVAALAKSVADIDHVISLPKQADGLTVGLKRLDGGRPRIYLNSSKPDARVRFTLAHELGHIHIGWHVGTIISHANYTEYSDASVYSTYEREANLFAAELLMPRTWIQGLCEENDSSPGKLPGVVASNANVSFQAALIRLQQAGLPGWLYVLAADDGLVREAGRSAGTAASIPLAGDRFVAEGLRAMAAAYESRPMANGVTLHAFWFRHRSTIVSGTLDWRNLQDELFADCGLDSQQRTETARSLAGIFGSANQRHIDLDSFVSRVKQRVATNSRCKDVLLSAKLDPFIEARAASIIRNR